MPFKIEEGKYYRTRDGKKRGPAVYDFNDSANLPWNVPNDYGDHWYDIYGVSCTGSTNNDLVAEWADTPKLWRDMTPEEKGALLLAHHEGKVIEGTSHELTGWVVCPEPQWHSDSAYRVKPEPKPEPKQQTQRIVWTPFGRDGHAFHSGEAEVGDWVLTFETEQTEDGLRPIPITLMFEEHF